MPYYFVVALLGLAAVVQTSLLPRFPVNGVRPDLAVVLVLAWGAASPTRNATLWGLTGGFWLDLFSGLPFGVQTLALGALGLVADLLESDFFRSSLITPAVTTFIATVLYYSLLLGMLQFLGRAIDWPTLLGQIILPAALLNTVLMPLVLALMRRIARAGKVELNV